MATINQVTEEEQYPTIHSDEKRYPSGTSLELTDELAKSVGYDSLEFGDLVEIRGKAFVKSKSIGGYDGSDKVEICFQLTELDVNTAGEDRAKQMYGDGE